MQLSKVHNGGKSILSFNGRDAVTGELQTFRVAPGETLEPVYADAADAAFVQHEGAKVEETKRKPAPKDPPETK